MTHVFHLESDLRLFVQNHRNAQKKIAFVPTMGNLHKGHLTLVEQAKKKADIVIVSIYVNPMQFGPQEDFQKYPRTFTADLTHLKALQVDALFLPSTDNIYPNGIDQHTCVRVDALDHMHCGESRPQFFSGIATVLTCLFNIVTPHIALFGEKDFQMLCIIKKMVHDLAFPIEILGVPTVRESNGLAYSSRNQYLSDKDQQHAAHLYQLLLQLKQQILDGNTQFKTLETLGIKTLTELELTPDYLNIVSQVSLKAPLETEKNLVILAACNFKQVRLIDNIQIN